MSQSGDVSRGVNLEQCERCFLHVLFSSASTLGQGNKLPFCYLLSSPQVITAKFEEHVGGIIPQKNSPHAVFSLRRAQNSGSEESDRGYHHLPYDGPMFAACRQNFF